MFRRNPEQDIINSMMPVHLELKWLEALRSKVEKVVSFGCGGLPEPLALLWVLKSREITVVDKSPTQAQKAYQDFNKLKGDPYLKNILSNFDVKNPIIRDMTQYIPELFSDNYDLAFCRMVLYQIPFSEKLKQTQDAWVENQTEENLKPYCETIEETIKQDPSKLQIAIEQMARVIKPSGYVIAVENTFGNRCPIDISHFFKNAGLNRISIPDSPAYAYCYQKPSL